MASLLSNPSALMGKIEGVGNSITLKGQGMLDRFFPPEKRAELLAKLKAWTIRNPKISAFLLTNIALTGPVLFLFILFSITVFIFALIVALVVGLLAAVGFTLFAVVTALVILFPTVFFTTLAATFIFLWGIGGYFALKWATGKGELPADDSGGSIGSTLNSLTGGRLDWVMDNARKTQDEKNIKEYDAKHGTGPSSVHDNPQKSSGTSTSNSNSNGSTNTPKKTAAAKSNENAKSNEGQNGSANKSSPSSGGGAKNAASNGVDGVKKNANVNGVSKAASGGAEKISKNANVGNVTKTVDVDGVTKKVPVANPASGAVGTVKGTLGGATGLM